MAMDDDHSYGPLGTVDELLQAADAATLRELVRHLAATGPHLLRECVEFLRVRLELAPASQANAKAEAMFALWDELEPALPDLDHCGGGPDETEDRVSELLADLAERAADRDIDGDDRWLLVDDVMPYIRSGNSGVEDQLYAVACAACHDDEDLRMLARECEGAGSSWSLKNARGIYRKVGDREKYLSLRMARMEYGADYYDLATFYHDAGERTKALEVAREGLSRAAGDVKDLRRFVAERALEAGDRGQYLELSFANAIDGLSLESYESFRKLCTPDEWATYEPRLLSALERADDVNRLEILMQREDYDRALAALMEDRYADWRLGTVMKVAGELERRYPEQIVAFYRRRLGSLNTSGSRTEYARKAQIVRNLRHVWVDVMKAPDEWLRFARKVKAQNQNRPAFQQEFARAVPDWGEM